MPLIRRRGISLSLKDMPKMTTTIRAHNFGPRHSKRIVRVSRHSARDIVEIRRPSATRLELVICFVERGVAASAGVDARLRHMLVVFADVWSFGSLLSENTELL